VDKRDTMAVIWKDGSFARRARKSTKSPPAERNIELVRGGSAKAKPAFFLDEKTDRGVTYKHGKEQGGTNTKKTV